MICSICKRIDQIKNGKDKHFVKELKTGYVVIGNYADAYGWTIFLCKKHKEELHELDKDFRLKFLEEMAQVAEAVHRAFNPDKLNYELLGNKERHLHWHIIPRYQTEKDYHRPIWHSVKREPIGEKLEELKLKLLRKFDNARFLR